MSVDEPWVSSDEKRKQDITKEIQHKLRDSAPELLECLKAFVDQEVDYMTRNKLGDPEKQHNVKWARSIISKITSLAPSEK